MTKRNKIICWAAARRYALILYGFSFREDSNQARLVSRSAISALLRTGGYAEWNPD
jgi:hypothetical protein